MPKVNQALRVPPGYSEKAMSRKNIRALTHPEDIHIDGDSRRQHFRGRVHPIASRSGSCM